MGDAGESITARLPELLDLLLGSDVLELEIQEGDSRLRIRRSGNGFEPIDEGAAAIEEPGEHLPSMLSVIAPLVGTFFSSPRPDAPSLVSVGSRVEDDTIVGIIEALNVLTEVEAGCRGVISAMRVEDGQAVEYGQILYEVEPGG